MGGGYIFIGQCTHKPLDGDVFMMMTQLAGSAVPLARCVGKARALGSSGGAGPAPPGAVAQILSPMSPSSPQCHRDHLQTQAFRPSNTPDRLST